MKMEIADQKLMDQGGGRNPMEEGRTAFTRRVVELRKRRILLRCVQESHNPSAGRQYDCRLIADASSRKLIVEALLLKPSGASTLKAL